MTDRTCCRSRVASRSVPERLRLGLIRNLLMLQPIHAPMSAATCRCGACLTRSGSTSGSERSLRACSESRRSASWIGLATLGLLLFHWTALLFSRSGASAHSPINGRAGRVRSHWRRPASAARPFGLSLSGRASVGNLPLKLTDVFVGLSFAWLLGLMKRRSYRIWVRTEPFNQALSNFSLFALRHPLPGNPVHPAAVRRSDRTRRSDQARVCPGPIAQVAVYAATALSTFALAFLFSRLFEARTAFVRRQIKDVL